jgi:phosphomannomutase/phosphoglucomutase
MPAPKLFGTNGIRGVVGEKLTPEFTLEIGLAMGRYLSMGSKVLVGCDTRTSNYMFTQAMVSGLLASGCHVIEGGVVPTPTLQYAVPRMEADMGVVLTASHNPPDWNGIKAIDSDGTELHRSKEEAIEKLYHEKAFTYAAWDKVGRHTRKANTDLINQYIGGIIGRVNASIIRSKGLKVVVDCANGTTSHSSPYLFERLGCKVVTLNAHPQGTFPGHDSEPVPENLTDLMNTVKNCDADIGIAHDGDGDRVIFIDDKGDYVYGDKSLALVAREVVEEAKGGIVVTGINSSQAVEDVVKASGGEVVYTPVGSPIVARNMIEVDAVFGGEENGGLMFPDHQYCRDGAMTAAKLLEIIASSGKSLSELTDGLPKYHQHKIKMQCSDNKKEEVMKAFADSIDGDEVITMDGVKVIEKGGWTLVRPSGTEEIVRVYAEAKTINKAKQLAEDSRQRLEEIIRAA